VRSPIGVCPRAHRVVTQLQTVERLEPEHARDEAQDRARVVDRVVDVSLLRERRDDECRHARARPHRSPFGGATWSHQPPFSSTVTITTMFFHCGLARSALTVCTMWRPPEATLA
jgi:hypothetical protein